MLISENERFRQEINADQRHVPEFIDPDLGMKTSIFVKNSPKRSVSFQFVARDAGISMF
jgi:hypothetical protein